MYRSARLVAARLRRTSAMIAAVCRRGRRRRRRSSERLRQTSGQSRRSLRGRDPPSGTRDCRLSRAPNPILHDTIRSTALTPRTRVNDESAIERLLLSLPRNLDDQRASSVPVTRAQQSRQTAFAYYRYTGHLQRLRNSDDGTN